MNREALRRLILARSAGWSYDQLANLYNVMKQQIELAVPGWRANHVRRVDGSHGFIGSKGPALVIMNGSRIFVGRFADDGLLSWKGMRPSPDGKFLFPPPNLRAAGTTEVK